MTTEEELAETRAELAALRQKYHTILRASLAFCSEMTEFMRTNVEEVTGYATRKEENSRDDS